MDRLPTLHRFSLQVPLKGVDLAVAELGELAPEGFEECELPRRGGAAGTSPCYVLYARSEVAPALSASLEALAETLREATGEEVSLWSETLADQNWREAWKVHFTLQRVPPFVIRPSWIDYAASPGEHVIHLDPGSAFGSGLHESTRLCMRAIAALRAEGLSPREVLDFGTGTGILGIAACLLFPCHVLAVDDDPLALTACEENASRNDVWQRFRLAPALPEEPVGADLTLANVSRPVLIEKASALVDATAPEGSLVLSGLLLSDEKPVLEAFERRGARLRECTRENDWLALRLVRSAP